MDGTTFHLLSASMYSTCGQFTVTDGFAETEEHTTCILCLNHSRIEELWAEYVAQPSNFGEDSSLVRAAEKDAFFAGAYAMLKTKVPF